MGYIGPWPTSSRSETDASRTSRTRLPPQSPRPARWHERYATRARHARSRWPRRCRPRTARCSRCPTRARPSGTSRTPPGSSRPSCSSASSAGFRPFDPAFRVLFNSYYQGVGEQHPRAAARPAHAADAGRGASATAPTSTSACAALLASARRRRRDRARWSTLGLHHEQQHQELLLTDIKHVLSLNPLRRRTRSAGRWRRCSRSRCAGSATTAGWSRSATTRTRRRFCFDNETPRHRAFVAPFELASRPVTLRRVPRLHRRRRLPRGPSCGCRWAGTGSQRRRASAPLYWERATASGWRDHTLQGMRRDRPAHAGVPPELLRGRRVSRAGPARGCRPRPSGSIAARRCAAPPRRQLRRPRRLPPAAAAGAGGDEPVQMFGDVWEWTAVALRALPGLPAARRARSASTTASSCATSSCCAAARAPRRAGHVRASYRNFFPPDAHWQFSGAAPGARRSEPRADASRAQHVQHLGAELALVQDVDHAGGRDA